MASQIHDILERPAIRTAIINEVVSFYQQDAQGIHRGDLMPFDSVQKVIWTEDLRRKAIKRLKSVWYELIAPELGLPAALTVRDFCGAVEMMFLRDPNDPQVTYESFVNFLTSMVSVIRYAKPMRVVVGPFEADDLGHDELWGSTKGFQVTLIGSLPSHDCWLPRMQLARPC